MGNINNRIGEIDFLRGIAIILMVIFHLLYDLNEFYGYEIDYQSGIVDYIGEIAALMFITITGISCSLSSNNLQRGLKILFFAFLITIITYIYDPNTTIHFGILHLLGVSVLLFSFFKHQHLYLLLTLGTLIIVIGNIFFNITLSTNYLLPFGFTSSTYNSLDYYPLLPYLGFFLYGIAIKKLLYPAKKNLFRFTFSKNPINYLGRHSLTIYLIHQPILLGILYLLAKVGIIGS